MRPSVRGTPAAASAARWASGGTLAPRAPTARGSGGSGTAPTMALRSRDNVPTADGRRAREFTPPAATAAAAAAAAGRQSKDHRAREQAKRWQRQAESRR